jgi:hypothetical protein
LRLVTPRPAKQQKNAETRHYHKNASEKWVHKSRIMIFGSCCSIMHGKCIVGMPLGDLFLTRRLPDFGRSILAPSDNALAVRGKSH